LYRQTDDSLSEESVDKEEDDWLLRQLSAAADSQPRKVRFDPYLDDAELFKLIDDEVYQPACVDLRSNPDDYVGDYLSRLQRFSTNIDYFINS